MRNLPNILSIGRLIATVLVYILVLFNQSGFYLLAALLFGLAAFTDFLDGYIARKYNLVSALGVFLDLTADKVLVAIVLIAMVEVRLIPGWIVAIIITREFLVTGLRSIAAARGRVIPAGVWGKQKTLITLLAMSSLLLAKGLGAYQLRLFPLNLVFDSQTLNLPELLLLLSDGLLVLATIWTLFSGIEYVIGALPIFRKETEKA